MKGYYEQKNYEKTIAYAEKVLRTPSIDNRIKSDAQIFIARSAIKTNDESRAKDAYAEVLKIASGSASEVEYCLILIKDLEYISEMEFKYLELEIKSIKKMLFKFIEKLK